MNNRDFFRRGGNKCRAKAGVAKHATNDQNLLTANAIVYSIDGKAYEKTATAEITTDALTQQAAGTSCMYVLAIDAAGTWTQLKGADILTKLVTDNVGTLKFPTLLTGTVAVAFYKVDAVNAFTHGTTAFDASGVTTTFNDCAFLPAQVN